MSKSISKLRARLSKLRPGSWTTDIGRGRSSHMAQKTKLKDQSSDFRNFRKEKKRFKKHIWKTQIRPHFVLILSEF